MHLKTLVTERSQCARGRTNNHHRHNTGPNHRGPSRRAPNLRGKTGAGWLRLFSQCPTWRREGNRNMRLVTARPNYFQPKIRSQKSSSCPRGNIVSLTSGAGQSFRFGRRPAISGLPPMTGHSRCRSACLKGANSSIGIFCKPSGSSAAECPRFDVDQIRLSQ
jgi:hypothetical protein